MKLVVTLEDKDAARILDLAWVALNDTLTGQDGDKKLLEDFRMECESAKGGKL